MSQILPVAGAQRRTPNFVEGTLDFELSHRWYVCITEVTWISIFAIGFIILEEREKNQFTIVSQHSQHEGKPFWHQARILLNIARSVRRNVVGMTTALFCIMCIKSRGKVRDSHCAIMIIRVKESSSTYRGRPTLIPREIVALLWVDA
jgi:hypothetical protein